MKEIWPILKDECLQIFYFDFRRAIFLFGAALAYSVIFGILYHPGVVKQVPCIIYNEDQTYFSRELVRQFEDSDSLKIVKYVSSSDEMRQSLQNKNAYAAITIPSDFSKQVKTGNSSTVLCMINGSNVILTNTVSTAVQDILARFSDQTAARRTALRLGMDEAALSHRISPVRARLRVLSNPTQSYMLFFVLGLAMAAFQQGMFLAVGAAIQYEYTEPKRWPGLSYYVLLLCKFAVYWILGMASFAMIITTAQYALGIYSKAPLWTLFVLGGAFSFTAISLSMLAAALSRTESQFVRGSIMYTVPAFIFSGYIWPLEAMGPVAGTMAKLFPMAWLSNAVRSLFLSGHLYDLQENIGILIGIGIIFLLALPHVFCRRMEAARKSVS